MLQLVYLYCICSLLVRVGGGDCNQVGSNYFQAQRHEGLFSVPGGPLQAESLLALHAVAYGAAVGHGVAGLTCWTGLGFCMASVQVHCVMQHSSGVLVCALKG